MTGGAYGPGDAEGADWPGREAAQAVAYDRIGDRYDDAFPHKEGQLACGNWLLARLDQPAPVLDVGCGTGLPTPHQLVAARCALTRSRISPPLPAHARRHPPQPDL